MSRAKRRSRVPTSTSVAAPMVYDGCYGFVQVEDASFDVSLTPEAIVLLPLAVLEDQRSAAAAEERRRATADARRARPRCDGRDHRIKTVTRAADGLLAFCAACAEGLDVAPFAERRALLRRIIGARSTHRFAVVNERVPVKCPGHGKMDRIREGLPLVRSTIDPEPGLHLGDSLRGVRLHHDAR